MKIFDRFNMGVGCSDELKKIKIDFLNRLLPNNAFVIHLNIKNGGFFNKNSLVKTQFNPNWKNIVKESILEAINSSFYGITLCYFSPNSEINLFFNKQKQFYKGDTTQIVSDVGSLLASNISIRAKFPVVVCGNVLPLPSNDCVGDYFKWRYLKTNYNCIFETIIGTLREQGFDKSYASNTAFEVVFEMEEEDRIKFLADNKIDLLSIDKWMKNGILFSYQQYKKIGFNPIKNRQELGDRRRLIVNEDLDFNEHSFSNYIKDQVKKA